MPANNEQIFGGGPAVRKYRLKIQYPVDEINVDLAAQLRTENLDGVVCKLDQWNFYIFPGNGRFALPAEWLTEIKEPLSFEEWNEETKISNPHMMTAYEHRKFAWKACLENQKLGVVDEEEDSKSLIELFDELKAIDSDVMALHLPTATIRYIWNLAFRNARSL